MEKTRRIRKICTAPRCMSNRPKTALDEPEEARPAIAAELPVGWKHSNSRWRVSDPLPPSAALPLTEPVQVMQKGPVLGKNRVKSGACRNNFKTGHRNRS